ncbi:MAG TPA: VWA domain-containing protein, partial [Acidobacteriota bacterium]|nr:VWA domain-containing protein [Acidobacteriota bacterium]
KLKWNSEVEMDQGSLERQIGLGGPLCYASSLRGPVEFRISAELETGQPVPAPPELTSTTPQPTPTGDQNVVEPEDQPEAQAPSASPTTVETQPADQAPVTKDPSGAYSTGYKLRLDVDWIYLNASVRERKTNRSVPNLRQSDFRVYEDGTEQTIGKFLQTEEPFHLLLLLDVSGSTQDYLDLIKDASIGFTRELGPEDKIAIATFNSDFRLRQDFTGDRKRAVEAIRGIRSGGGTAVYDALFESVNHVRRVDGRKAIVLFSDGVDNQLQGYGGEGSRATFDQLYREIQEVDALIYTIFLDTESTGGWTGGGSGTVIDILGDILRGGRRPGGRYPRPPVYRRDNSYEEARRQMEMIAEQTGARMYAPDRISDLATVYSEIANDLRVQYTLGYNSTNPNSDGSWREVKVSIVNRPDLVVRTRKGYYARQLTTAEKR